MIASRLVHNTAHIWLGSFNENQRCGARARPIITGEKMGNSLQFGFVAGRFACRRVVRRQGRQLLLESKPNGLNEFKNPLHFAIKSSTALSDAILRPLSVRSLAPGTFERSVNFHWNRH